MSAIVAIVGDPNVGKFNFLIELIQRERPLLIRKWGVTRDRSYERVMGTEWSFQ